MEKEGFTGHKFLINLCLNMSRGKTKNLLEDYLKIFTILVEENRKYRKKKENNFINDTKLRNEYLSKVDKGAFLHKYAGLWTLGLDLLPPSVQRSLHLFVYQGCVCGIEAFVG